MGLCTDRLAKRVGIRYVPGVPLTYREAGVDIDAGDQLVRRIKPAASRTAIPEVLGSLGGFAGLCRIPEGMRDPVLVSGTDGVGTKLKIAFEADRHDTVGVDLVAMCVNDIATTAARPLFFLDYFATGRLDVERAAKVIEGIAAACEEAGCALLGGETAELPGMYHAGEYDMAGFAVGVVERDALLTGADIRAGDVVLGLASSGLHSNGFSLARKALFERAGIQLQAHVPDLGEPLIEALIRPTRIYTRACRVACEAGGVRAFSHITGGGLAGNIPRVLPEGLGVWLDPGTWERPVIFDVIARAGEISEPEMRRAFNLGLGMTAIVAPERADTVLEALRSVGERAAVVGEVVDMPDATPEARVRFGDATP